MLKWALTFLVVSVVAGALGFAGVSEVTGRIAKILFGIFLVVATAVLGRESDAFLQKLCLSWLDEQPAESDAERAERRLVLARESANEALDLMREFAKELRLSETSDGLRIALENLMRISVPEGVHWEVSLEGEEEHLAFNSSRTGGGIEPVGLVIAGFGLLGIGIAVVVPLVFAAAGRSSG